MAAFHGKTGSVAFGGSRCMNVLSWSIRAACDAVDATTMIPPPSLLSAWASLTLYNDNAYVYHNSVTWRCLLSHTSSASDEPGVGANYRIYWTEADFKNYNAGYKGWEATVECLADDAGPDPDLATDLTDDDGATLILYTMAEETGCVDYYTGTAIVKSVAPSADARNMGRVTYSFQGSGALTEHIAS